MTAKNTLTFLQDNIGTTMRENIGQRIKAVYVLIQSYVGVRVICVIFQGSIRINRI